MEALFPTLLFLGPYFTPTILRVALAVYFFLHANRHWKKKNQKSKLLGAKEAAFALLLLGGFLTQLVAAAGILLVLFRGMWLKDDHQETWVTKVLAVAALLALVISGAGAFAIDLPY